MYSQGAFHDSPTIGTSANAEILNFDNFRENLTRKLTLKNWFLMSSHQNVHIFSVEKKANGNLSIRNTIAIDIELTVKVYGEHDDTLFSLKLCSWPQLHTLIDQFSCNVDHGGDVFVVSVIDEERLYETSSEVKKDYEIDQGAETVKFEFCATNGDEDEANVSQRLSSIVKVEPTDFLDSPDTFVSIKNEIPEQNEQTVEPDQSDRSSAAANDVTRECTICDKKFSTKKKFRNHMYLHDRSKFKECNICNVSCFNIRRHIESVHKNVRKDVCYICGAAYKQLSSLKEHMAAKHNEVGEFFCDICKNGKNYRTKAYMKAHLYSTHIKAMKPKPSERTKYECSWCNEQLASKFSLKSHVASQHEHSNDRKLPQYPCVICGKLFKRKQSLTNHEILHTGKKFICTECGHSFGHPDYLAKHRRVHKEIKYKECTMCEKRYAQNYDLRQHTKNVHGVILPKLKRNTKS